MSPGSAAHHTLGYWNLIPAALMICAAPSLSLRMKRANSGCVIVIGSPPCLATQSRRSPGAMDGATRCPQAEYLGVRAFEKAREG